jgi:ATP-binding cassette subfamily C protein CydD
MTLDRRLFRQAKAAQRGLVLAVGLGFLAGIAVVGQARILSRVVSQVFLAGQSLGQIMPGLIILVIVSLVRGGLVWGSELAAGRVAVQIKHDLREQLVARLLSLGPAYTQGERSGELANTAIEGIEALDAYFRQYLPQLALAALVPLGVLFFVFPLDWISGLVLLLTAPLIPVFMILIGSVANDLTRRQWLSLSRMSAHFLDMLQGLTTLKLLGRSQEQAQTIARISDEFRQATMGVLRVAFLSALVLEMVATLSTAVVAVQIGLRLLYGQLAFEYGFFVLLLAPEFYLPLRILGSRFHVGTEGVSAAQRVFEILQAPDRIQAGTPGSHPLARSAFHIRFSDICYAYDAGHRQGSGPYTWTAPPGAGLADTDTGTAAVLRRCTRQRPALDGLCLEIKPGEKVALVGPSGAGKSTVAHLLLRFVEPDGGTITVDGIPLSQLSPSAWRQQVAWVPQNPYLFYGTVAENILLGQPPASRSELIQAASLAHAQRFIEALPQGYETVIGERGARLSGGEAQRIALARAFLKNAPFLILDEATANLDPEAEDEIQEAMARLLHGRTALVIAHRLTMVVRADRILVMDGGRVVQQGTHTELVQCDGLYRRLAGAYVGSR